jgi:hypothetical protein
MRNASARTVVAVALVVVAVGVVVVALLLNRGTAAEPPRADGEDQPVQLITPSAPGESTPEASPSDSPKATPSTSASGDITPKGLTAEELVMTAAQTMTTWNATEDRSETAAYRRALPLFVEDYEQIFTAPQRPTLPAEWREAAKNEAVSVPEVEITGSSKQGEATIYQVVTTWTWTDHDGWELDAGPKHMQFQVRPEGQDFIIENWSENGFQ